MLIKAKTEIRAHSVLDLAAWKSVTNMGDVGDVESVLTADQNTRKQDFYDYLEEVNLDESVLANCKFNSNAGKKAAIVCIRKALDARARVPRPRATSQPPSQGGEANVASLTSSMQETSFCSTSGAFRYQPAACAGRALILSVNKGREKGAKAEREKAALALRMMGYEVETIVDPTKDACLSKLRELRDASWGGYASSVVAIMAHGYVRDGATHVLLADGNRVSMASLYGMISSNNCPGLANKPKIWIVQACRGGGMETIVETDMAGHQPAILGAEHDNLISYATSPGHSAQRGVFWKAVHKIMAENPTEHVKMPWMDILGQANHAMAVEGITSTHTETHLRDNTISPAQLQSRR